MAALPARAASVVRSWYRSRLVRRFPTRIVEHTFGGHRLKVALVDPLSAGWYDRDWPVLPEVHLLKESRLRPGARVFNLGAHQALVAMMLARETGPDGQVIAVEPVPHNAQAAVRNRDLNGVGHLTILEAAVGAHSGTIQLRDGLQAQIVGESGNPAGDSFTAEVVTIDDLASRFGTPDVLFIDVEGAEHLALSGGTGVLTTGPDVFVELHVGCGLEALGGSVAQVLAHFPADKFTMWIRAEDDPAFQPFRPDHPLLRDRCFLVARAT